MSKNNNIVEGCGIGCCRWKKRNELAGARRGSSSQQPQRQSTTNDSCFPRRDDDDDDDGRSSTTSILRMATKTTTTRKNTTLAAAKRRRTKVRRRIVPVTTAWYVLVCCCALGLTSSVVVDGSLVDVRKNTSNTHHDDGDSILSLQRNAADHTTDGLSSVAKEGVSSMEKLMPMPMPTTKPLLDTYRELALRLEDSKDDDIVTDNKNETTTRIIERRRLDIEDEDDLDDDPADGLAVVVTFEEILRLLVFFAVAWMMSNGSSALGMPGLVGEIITGFLLGPPLADFCPFPEAIVMIGNVGLIGLMLESGIHLDIAQLKETGTRAVTIALSGTILGLATGLALGFIRQDDNFPAAMAVGASFAPSSLGVAAAVLSTGQVLNTPIGQLIVASSVVDDVLGLTLLGILNVLAMDDPTPFNYFQPFLASFGFLAVLGYLGLSIFPKLLRKHILPRIPQDQRGKATSTVMFLLLIIYLPLLNYSGASYLTGAFLAGLSVSQIPAIHSIYEKNGRELMVWLMRIFFTATIGFQIPILKYGDLDILIWSGKFLVPVIAKLPLGLLVPRFRKDVPEDFPFDPFWRDAWITSLSVVCRGEFNVVVASFGLSTGLLGPDLYSAIVMAVLVSAIVGPLLLSQTIKYYNRLSEEYLSSPHPLQRINDKSKDGFRPLFIAIQVRTPVSWGLQERFQHVLQDLGLLILDHRTWHTNSVEAVAMSEIFVQDTVKNVPVKNCFADSSTSTTASSTTGSDVAAGDDENLSHRMDGPSDREGSLGLGICSVSMIEERLTEVREALKRSLDEMDSEKFAIKATQWEPFIQEPSPVATGHERRRTYTFQDSRMLSGIFDGVGGDNSHQDEAEDHGGADEVVTNSIAETFRVADNNTSDEAFDSLSVDLGVDLPSSSTSVDASSEKQEADENDTSSTGIEVVAANPHNPSLPSTLPPRPAGLLRHRRAVSHGMAVSSPMGGNSPMLSEISRPSPGLDRSVSLGINVASPLSLPRPQTHHTRTVSHGGMASLRQSFQRQVSSTPRGRVHSTGQCDGRLLDCDLWETDEIAHKCVRRGECAVQPTVAGHTCDRELNQELEALVDDESSSDDDNDVGVNNTENDYFVPHTPSRIHGHRRDPTQDQQETTAIQHMLHGYIRH